MTVRLAELEADLPTVELPGGEEVTVRRLDGVAAGLWYEWSRAESDDDRDPRILWQVAARCLPSVAAEVVEGLTAPQAAAVIAVASGNVEKVLEALKGGMRVEDIPALACDPTIQSAPSSSPSPEPPAEPPGASP